MHSRTLVSLSQASCAYYYMYVGYIISKKRLKRNEAWRHRVGVDFRVVAGVAELPRLLKKQGRGGNEA